ncbi:MAG: aromatic amino acid transport family protein [Candidatus Nanoarchaeia archaeon]|nr:aromatic amino acid transport family protein [Candidatus Nanoarchaeia archaeon]
MKKEVFRAAATLMGTIIGAGVLGIPYVVSKAGFLTGLVDIIFIGVMMLILNLYLGQIVLSTKENHQLTGYANKYLGKSGKYLMFLSIIIGDYGALIAYLIGEGSSLSAIFGGSNLWWSIAFFFVVAFLIFKGIKRISFSELIISSLILVTVVIIGILSFSQININNLTSFNFNNLVIPYGVVVFAFLGLVSIQEVKEVLVKDKKEMKKAILIGSIIPIIVYCLFALIVVGVTGINTTEIATIGLGNYLGIIGLILGNIFAIFAMFTSFLALGLAMKETYLYDFKLNENTSYLLAVLVPLFAFLILRNVATFTKVLNFAGFLAGGIAGILVILITFKTEKLKSEYKMPKSLLLKILIILILVGGVIYNLI